jgi:hypothetical protein
VGSTTDSWRAADVMLGFEVAQSTVFEVHAQEALAALAVVEYISTQPRPCDRTECRLPTPPDQPRHPKSRIALSSAGTPLTIMKYELTWRSGRTHTDRPINSAIRSDLRHSRLIRIASSLCADMIFGRHNRRCWLNASATTLSPTISFRNRSARRPCGRSFRCGSPRRDWYRAG